MTVSVSSRRTEHVGNGSTTSFAVNFQFYEIAVYIDDVLQASGYTVTGGNGSTGNVVFTLAPENGKTITILGATDVAQETDFVENGPFPADTLEATMDRQSMSIQETNSMLARTLRANVSGAEVDEINFGEHPNSVLITDEDGIPTLIGRGALQSFVEGAEIALDVATLVELAESDEDDDYLLIYDDSAELHKRILAKNLGVAVTGTGAVSRKLGSKLSEFVSVKDFGATGDGVTDDTAAIVLACAASKQLYWPDGTYRLSSVTPQAGSVWIGSGNATIKTISATATTVVGDAGIKVFNLTFDGALLHSRVASQSYAMLSVGGACTVRDCSFLNVGRFGINIKAVTRLRIIDNDFIEGAGHSGTANETCVFIYGNTQSITSATHSIVVRGNYFYDSLKGDAGRGTGGVIISQYTPNPDAKITITDNDFAGYIGCYSNSNFIGCVYLYYGTSRAIVANNRMKDWIWNAINVGGSGQAIVSGNAVGEHHSSAGNTSASAIQLSLNFNNSGTVVSRDHVICTSNHVASSPGNGIAISGTNPGPVDTVKGAVVANNNVRNCALVGIVTQFVEDALIQGNVVEDCGTHCIQTVSSAGRVAIIANSLRRAGNALVYTETEAGDVHLTFMSNIGEGFSGTFGFRLDDCKTLCCACNQLYEANGTGKTGLRVNGTVDRQFIFANDIVVTSGTATSIGTPSSGGQAQYFNDPTVLRTLAGSPEGVVTAAFMGQLIYDTSNAHIYMAKTAGGTSWSNLSIGGDPDLAAISVLTGTGFPARTADNTWAMRSVAAGNGVSVSNPAGVAGNPTLAAKSYVLAMSAVAVPLTGTTTETALATINVPANTLGANGTLRVTAHWSYTNSANNKNPRIRFSGASGTVFAGPTLTTTANFKTQVDISNRNATNSQVGFASGAATGGQGSTSGALVTSAVDTTAATTVVLTGQLANTGETITLEYYCVEVITA